MVISVITIIISVVVVVVVVVVGLMKQVHMITTVLLPKKSRYLKLGIFKNTALYLINDDKCTSKL
jgi:hypothetical protein